MAILIAVTFPNFMRFLPSYRLSAAADDLFSDMQYAKMRSINTNQEWAVSFDTANNRYSVISDYGDTDVTYKTVDLSTYDSGVRYGHGAATSKVANDPAGALPADNVSYSGTGLPDNIVVFTPKGMVRTRGYVYLTNDANHAAAVGTPVISGIVAMRRWHGAWE
jgi:Tfp pilus assembly protein FimT